MGLNRKGDNSIKSWAEEDRPREKLLSRGIDALTNAELIAILFRSGSKNESAVQLGRKLLQIADNNLNSLGKLDINKMLKVKGVGPAKAISLMAALELGKRRKIDSIVEKKVINSSKDVFYIFGNKLSDLLYEEFWVIILNKANKIIEKKKISQGGISETVVDTRLILKLAIEKAASGVILCHNHPSGNVRPSSSDKKVTENLIKAAAYFGIQVLDHIIVSDNDYYSFADNGKMK